MKKIFLFARFPCVDNDIGNTPARPSQGSKRAPVEKQKIEALIKQVGDLKDAHFVRNGSTYEPATAVRFLRGKWRR